MKVILSHGYFLHEDEAERKIMMPYPPQGLLHIGTYLKSKGFDCQIYDSTFKSFADLCIFLEEEKPKYLGLYVNLMTRPNIIKIIGFIRNSDSLRNLKIILGGPDVRYHTKKYIQKGADYCLSGEGEHAILQLINAIESGNSEGIQSVKGLTCRNEKKEIIFTGEPELISSLDDLPFPDFEMIDLQKYFSAWSSNHGYNSMTISTMRGCPYSCRWCSKAVFGRSFRRRSAALVVDELLRLQKAYSPDRFWIVDDVFTISKKWLTEFRDAVNATKLKIKYECITRADRMDQEIIDLLKESGCYRLWIGAESGSQKVLDLMDRGVKAEVVQEMIKMTKQAGIESGTFLMLGYPGETEKDILKTVEHLKTANPDLFTLTLSYPIPGTGFYTEVKNKGLIVPGEWGTYSDRELDFKRTYKSSYYRYAIPFVNHALKSHRYFIKGNRFKSWRHKLISLALRTMMFINK